WTDWRVLEEGWIVRFLGKIEGAGGWIKPVTFSEYMEKEGPLGRVYLPTASYMEMGEWALFPEASGDYARLLKEIKSWRDGERILRFLQGGTWRNFLAKYPEADWMHKRMLDVSGKIERNKDKDVSGAALRHLYMAQCNDAYWHGIFGGLYLPHLRAHIYENLLKAETLVDNLKGDEVSVRTIDINADTCEEVVISTEDLNLFFSPAMGGSLVEMDWRKGYANLSNTLSRWSEGYHMKLKEAGREVEEGARSIHDGVVSKEEGLERHLKFDSVRRTSLREHFLGEDETLERLSAGEGEELGDFFNGLYGAEVTDKRLILSRTGRVRDCALKVLKEVRMQLRDSFSVGYRLEGGNAGGGLKARFGVEMNLCLPGCNGPDSSCEFNGLPEDGSGMGSKGETHGVADMRLVDRFSGLKVSFVFDRPVTVWRYPVETVSLSEAGFERNYQGSAMVFLLPLALPCKDPFAFSFSVKVETIEKEDCWRKVPSAKRS
ncbi:MAG: DUF1926 domain-containing protein, partial [Deltaproteobacteria bacterium]|nr:DUF1926 domain-containing protein [Deltaproteobacteria bacterium]